VQDAAEKLQLLQGLAGICDSCGLKEQAEKRLRQAVEVSPLGYKRLATWLASVHRSSEAIDLCIKVASEDETSEAVVTLASVLSLSSIKDADRDRTESVFELALDKHSQDKNLLLSVATLRLMQNRPEDAIKLFRRTLGIAPRDLMALNNLAILLADRPADQAEALKKINQALDIGGRNPQLLDTKGWILIQQKAYPEAEEVLREAVAIPPADHRHWFHLALAYWRQGKKELAKQSLDRAHNDPLIGDLLSPVELAQWAQLKQDLH
jgi:Flp pilus assembly protein TadD